MCKLLWPLLLADQQPGKVRSLSQLSNINIPVTIRHTGSGVEGANRSTQIHTYIQNTYNRSTHIRNAYNGNTYIRNTYIQNAYIRNTYNRSTCLLHKYI